MLGGSLDGSDVGLLPGFASGETDIDGFQMHSAVQGKNAISAQRSVGRAQRVMADFPLHAAAHLIPRRRDEVGGLMDGVWQCFISA